MVDCFNFRCFPAGIFNLRASFLNGNTILVSWDSTLENINRYDVIILKDTDEVRRVGTGNTSSSVEIKSLDQCRNYTVKVAANSSVGAVTTSVEVVTRCGKFVFECNELD